MSTLISFEQEQKLVSELHALLKSEQSSLIENDIDAIETLLDQKAQLLQALGSSSKSRYEALASQGFEASESGMSQWIVKQQAAVRNAWVGLQRMLNEAKELNRVNGMLVNKFFRRNQQMLALLQSGGNQSAGLYGANGQALHHKQMRGAVLG